MPRWLWSFLKCQGVLNQMFENCQRPHGVGSAPDADVYFFLCSASSLPRTVSFPIPSEPLESLGPPQSVSLFFWNPLIAPSYTTRTLRPSLLISVTGPHFTTPSRTHFARVRPPTQDAWLRNQTSWHSTLRSMLKTERGTRSLIQKKDGGCIYIQEGGSHAQKKQLRTVTFFWNGTYVK